MSSRPLSDIRAHLEEASTDYLEARRALAEAAVELQQRKRKLENALSSFYTGITGYHLPIRTRKPKNHASGEL